MYQFNITSCCSKVLCRLSTGFITVGEDSRCPHCRSGIWNPLFVPYIHRQIDDYVEYCARDGCQEFFADRASLENHTERCNRDNPITDDELDNYLHIYTPHAFCDLFYYNLPLIYRLAEYASVDLWWYSLDLQDFLNENDFGNGNDIFMWIEL